MWLTEREGGEEEEEKEGSGMAVVWEEKTVILSTYQKL